VTDRSGTPAIAASDGEQPAPARGHSTRWRDLRAAAAPLVLALLIFVLSRAAVAEYQVEGTSMSPTVHSGQYILVDALSYRFHQPQRGDVVVFRFPLDTTQNFIKRVIGVPGDVVEVRAGTVLVDGNILLADGRLQSIDENRTLADAQRCAEAIMARSGLDRFCAPQWKIQ